MEQINAPDFFRCLSDPSRLHILTVLRQSPMHANLLANRLGLPKDDILHHLDEMIKNHIVSMKNDHNETLYFVEESVFCLSISEIIGLNAPTLTDTETPEEKYRKSVYKAFIKQGKLTALPAQKKKRMVILDMIINLFEKGKVYQEKEVNFVIMDIFEDYCTLRRELIINGLMTRENGVYQRV